MLYSVLGRYHQWSKNPSIKHTIVDLFGIATAAAIIDFPCHIGSLVSRLPRGTMLTGEYLIDNHTLFPLFRPFLPDGRSREIFNAMMSDDRGMAIDYLVGNMASTVHDVPHLRFCEDCLDHDVAKFGEPYWHRLHQLPGVWVCPVHGRRLSLSGYSTTARHNKHQFHILEEGCRTLPSGELSDKDIAHSKAVTQLYELLLLNKFPSFDLKTLLSRYRESLRVEGWMTACNRIRQRDLLTAFDQYYGREFLSRLGCDVNGDQNDNWLSKFMRSTRSSSHPLRHILVMQFLGLEFEDFLTARRSKAGAPFGNGPWPCLNPASDHYRKCVVRTCKVSRDSKLGVPVGTFSCSCGFVYSRRGPDTSKGDRYRYGRIKEFGAAWDNVLLNLHSNEHNSLREIARQLRVDPKTVKHRIDCLLNSDRVDDQQHPPTVDQRTHYREKWTSTIVENHELTKTQIRQLEPATYMWLYRHDREWLNSCVVTYSSQSRKFNRVDWCRRDMEISDSVRKAAAAIHDQTEKPIRITVSVIGKLTGNLHFLQKHISKLPETQVALQQVTESIINFQIRRVKWTAAEMRIQGECVREWKLMRMAGLRSSVSIEVREKVKKETRNDVTVSVKKGILRR